MHGYKKKKKKKDDDINTINDEMRTHSDKYKSRRGSSKPTCQKAKELNHTRTRLKKKFMLHQNIFNLQYL